MKKKDKKKLEDIKNYIANLESKKDITDGDVDELSNLIDKAVNGTKLERLFSNIFVYVIRIIILFITSVVIIGVLFNEIALENKYNVFYVCLVVSGVLALIDFVPFITKKGINMVFFILLLLSILIGVLVNDIVPIFRFSSMWIVYIIFIEVIYNLFRFSIAKRALEKMR